jgi:hypothetical protein
MSSLGGPNIITDGLVLHLDAANTKSYVLGSTTWYDKSGNNNTGSLVNGPTFNSANGGTIVFDGIDDYSTISIPSISESSMTFSFYFKSMINSGNDWKDFATLTTTANTVLAFEKGGNNGFALTNNYLKVYPIIPYNSSYLPLIENAGFYVGNNNICNFTLTVNTSSWVLYGNGILYGSGSVSGITTNVFNKLTLGNDTSRSSRASNCQIYNVQLYNRALSAAEVLQNYNATKARFNL